MRELTTEDRARLQEQDIAVGRCPKCKQRGTFMPNDTVLYECGSSLIFGQRRSDRRFEQSPDCTGPRD
jgi:hypothetical protein